MGDPDLSREERSAPQPRGMVVFSDRPGAERHRPARRGVTRFLPFLITLAAGAIVVAIVALLINGHSTVHQSPIPLPPPSRGSTPPANIHP
jgi:hypothetical protein